jgi:hypothetical protein
MTALTLKSVSVAENYEAYVLPVSGYPMPHAERDRVDSFVRAFCAVAAKRWSLSPEVFMQLEQLDTEGCRETFGDNARDWLPQTGLGVWVDRDPPQKWTEAELANIVPGDKLRPIMYQVFRVSTELKTRVDAASLMLRFGPVIEILTPLGEAYLPESSPIFKEGIVDRSFTCFPYYVALMEAKTLTNASPEHLKRWFQGMSVYVRQSFEDKGILIASAVPLTQIFEEMKGSHDQAGWTFQI